MWPTPVKKAIGERIETILTEQRGFSIPEEDKLQKEFADICLMPDGEDRTKKEGDFQDKLLSMEASLAKAKNRRNSKRG